MLLDIYYFEVVFPLRYSFPSFGNVFKFQQFSHPWSCYFAIRTNLFYFLISHFSQSRNLFPHLKFYFSFSRWIVNGQWIWCLRCSSFEYFCMESTKTIFTSLPFKYVEYVFVSIFVTATSKYRSWQTMKAITVFYIIWRIKNINWCKHKLTAISRIKIDKTNGKFIGNGSGVCVLNNNR